MDWTLNYLPHIFMSVGIITLIIEVMVLGFATFIFFFAGLAVFLTGLAMYTGILDSNINVAFWSSVILTTLLAVILWTPLKKIQNRQVRQDNTSDFAQQTFTLPGNINSSSNDVLHSYSGISWKLRSQQPLQQGQLVKVVKTEVGIMWVEAIDKATT